MRKGKWEMEVKIKNEVCKKLGVEIGQVFFQLQEDNDIHLHGSVSWEEERDLVIGVKANLCDLEGRILYNVNDYGNILLNICGYNTFSIYCSDVSRFFNVEKLSYIEVFPYVKVKD